MVVDHAGRLHQRVTDCRTDKLESTAEKIAAHGVGFLCARRHLRWAAPPVLKRFAADETPEISIETSELFSHFKKCLRVLDRGRDLEAVADDSLVAEQSFHLTRSVARDFLDRKSVV